MADTAIAPSTTDDSASSFRRITIIRVVTIVAIWLLYEAAARSNLFFEGVVPSSTLVLKSLFSTLADPRFYPHLWQTLFEVIVGFLIGTTVGLAAGVTFGMSSTISRILNPWVYYLAPAPKIIFLPILMLLFGVGIGSKIAMAAISAFFPVAVSTYAGMTQVKDVYVRVATTFNAGRTELITKVYFPSLVGPVMTSLRLALGVAFIGTLLAEIKLSNVGLGHLIIQDYNFLRIPQMYATLLITFILAIAANSFMGWLAEQVEYERGN